MTPEQLKASILQYAIQGKLVEQRPEEGTGEELYQQIQAEKQRLIKEGKIKKEKALPEISEDEFPFEIPESWKWVRLSTIGITQTGNTPSKSHPEYIGIDIPFITPGDILNGQICYNNQALSLLGKNVARVCDEDSIMQVCIGGSIGKVAIADRKVAFNQQINVVSPLFCLSKYLFAVMQSVYFTTSMKERAGGTATPIINRGLWDSLCIPLPPLAEQTRIVTKIEELLPYIDRYAASYERLEQVNTEFPEDMKKSVLQYAIQGKLVEQRAEEGTGEELYQQIQTEKQRLIKEGKIKKEKPLPEVAEDEIPFDIPESWKWVRLSEIISVLGDGIHGTPVFDEMGDYYFVNGNNLAKGHIVFKADTKKVSFDEYEKHKKPLDENTILISINGTIGNYAFYAGEPIILGKSACYFSVLTGVDKEYVRHLINTKFFMDYAVKEATQTTIKNVSLKAMRMLPVPLPPLAEQKRIVAKLEEILPLCERLK
uniref:restriction endonuclease subunit S n=1 Tax=Faecousia sp. TaxID=2952921 RepID=UPI004029EAEB